MTIPASPPAPPPSPFARMRDVMARLRDPVRGCPWDREQSFATIAPYTIEEAYEVADAIERDDYVALKDELGDLLFQVFFHARLAEEAGLFAVDDVAASLIDKMVRRHPHVFGDAHVQDVAAQALRWEEHKAVERGANSADPRGGALAGVPSNLPALARAQKVQKRASRVGFDWGEAGPALAKVSEEVVELGAELGMGAEPGGAEPGRIEEEMGDLLFACVNVARLAGVDAETALRRATRKFERRFRRVEALLAERGRTPAQSTLAEMDALWNVAKTQE